jgi:hypothetical protein
MSKLQFDKLDHSHAAQIEPEWHRDCLSLTVILASALDSRTMRKFLTQAGYIPKDDKQGSDDLLESLHIACHQDPRLVVSITKALNKKYRSSLAKTRSMQPDEISEQARSLSWPVPLLWACFQHDAPGLRAQGRRLAHLVLWNAISRLRKQPRQDEQQNYIERLAQENQSLRKELQKSRKALKKIRSLKSEARPAPAPLPVPDGIQHEITALKKSIKPLKQKLESEKRQKERLQKEFAVWRALALNRDQAEAAASCPGFSPLQTSIPPAPGGRGANPASCSGTDCAGCSLQGARVAVIGGLKRMEPNYSEVVGKLGGKCLCHTGSVVSGCRRLRQVVRKADLVVFITTVNSHTAINTVKDECKKCGKPFCALGRTGAGSLEKALLCMAA